jgi:hypothetical protein
VGGGAGPVRVWWRLWALVVVSARHDLALHTVSIIGVLPRLVGGAGGWGFGGGWMVVGWLLVENCTVDASILFSVVKLSRADGGCLGTRSR